jgi:hypothetical protein
MINHLTIQRLKQYDRIGRATPPSTPTPDDLSAFDALATSISGVGTAMTSLVSEQSLLTKGTGRLINIAQNLTNTYINAAKELLWLEKRNEALTKTFGLTIKQAGDYGAQLDDLSVGFKKGGASIRVYAENLKTVIGNFKLGTKISTDFSTKLLRTQEIITDSLGLSAEQAANYELFAAGANKDGTELLVTTNAIAKEIEIQTGQQGLFKDITADVADLTADLQIQYSRIPGSLEIATVKAKALGLSVDKLNKAGANLLNIESSIGQELEYQLLSGRRLITNQGKSITNEYRVAQLRGDASKQADLMNEILEKEGDTLENNLFARQQMSQLLGTDEASLARALQKKKILEKIGGGALFELSGQALYDAAKGLGTSAEDLAALADSQETRSTEKILASIEDKLITQGVRINIGAGQGDLVSQLSSTMTQNASDIGQVIQASGPAIAKSVAVVETAVNVVGTLADITTDLAAAFKTGGWAAVLKEAGDKIGNSTLFGTSNEPLAIGSGYITAETISVSGIKPMAKGGSVAASTPYVVGEVGPELFVPNSSGTIIPNNQMATNGGSADVTSLANAIVAAFQSGVKLQVTTDPTFSGGGMNQGRYS